MDLPVGFQFSQGNLQDFIDCKRRFLLKYIYNLSWPALETEAAFESERFLMRGSLFHKLVHQHLLGFPSERLSLMIHDQDLDRWWRNYLDHLDSLFKPIKGIYTEQILLMQLEKYRLIAVYDLILHSSDDKFIIVDWKTSRRHPNRTWLANRLQTRIYPYILVQTGKHLNFEQPIQPSQIEMLYWFTNYPDQPERFIYNQTQYERDFRLVSDIVQEIIRLQESQFELTFSTERCQYCIYRSLCDRGKGAGAFDETILWQESKFLSSIESGFDLIAEIEF